jgi:hypothetical protein
VNFLPKGNDSEMKTITREGLVGKLKERGFKKGARRRAGADYSAVISKIFVTFVPLSSSTAAPNRKTPF